MTDPPILPGWDHRHPFATGVARYQDHPRGSSVVASRIYLEVWPRFLRLPVLAMVDTAAPWCIFDSEVGEMLQDNFAPVSGELSLSTRLGLFSGHLYRAPLTFPSTTGGPFEVEATVFVSPDWPGGDFLGYEGLLQRIRFAIDPETNLFYFGQI